MQASKVDLAGIHCQCRPDAQRDPSPICSFSCVRKIIVRIIARIIVRKIVSIIVRIMLIVMVGKCGVIVMVNVIFLILWY